MLNVLGVVLSDGIINTEPLGQAPSVADFFSWPSVDPVRMTVPVVGWSFPEIHITHGDAENGIGFAFRSVTI